MIRDRQHGPVVELNRIALRRSRATGTSCNAGPNSTVFAQMANKLSLLTYDVLMLPHRTWKVKFVGITLFFSSIRSLSKKVLKVTEKECQLLYESLFFSPTGESVDDCGGGYR
jgi:hypothetical protein